MKFINKQYSKMNSSSVHEKLESKLYFKRLDSLIYSNK